jgi:nitrile hydratase
MASFAVRPDSPAGTPVSAVPPVFAPTPVPAPRGWPGGETSFRAATASPRFAAGQAVVTRNVHPTGHTRLPRYARGKRGAVATHRGCHVFPDTNAHGLGEQPQHVYSVRFTARELWGEAADPNPHVYLDLWESYLLPG